MHGQVLALSCAVGWGPPYTGEGEANERSADQENPRPFPRAALLLNPSHSGQSGPFPEVYHAWTQKTWTKSETRTLKVLASC